MYLEQPSNPICRPRPDLTRTELDPSFVFDFVAYDEPRRRPALVDLARRRAALPRPRAPPGVGGDLPGCDRHRARHPQDRQGGRRLPPRTRRPARARAGGRDGRQALPRARAPLVPPIRHLHRGPQHEAVPRRAGDQAEEHLRPRGGGRRVGRLGVVGAGPVLGPGAAGPLPGPDRRHRAADGVDHRRRRDGAHGLGADPARPAAARVVLRPAARCHGNAGPGRPGARRPVALQHPGRRRPAGDHRPARSWSTSSATRPGFDFLLRDCTNVCDWFARRGLEVDGQELFGDLMAPAF